jgi:hypothetical protein
MSPAKCYGHDPWEHSIKYDIRDRKFKHPNAVDGKVNFYTTELVYLQVVSNLAGAASRPVLAYCAAAAELLLGGRWSDRSSQSRTMSAH